MAGSEVVESRTRLQYHASQSSVGCESGALLRSALASLGSSATALPCQGGTHAGWSGIPGRTARGGNRSSSRPAKVDAQPPKGQRLLYRLRLPWQQSAGCKMTVSVQNHESAARRLSTLISLACALAPRRVALDQTEQMCSSEHGMSPC